MLPTQYKIIEDDQKPAKQRWSKLLVTKDVWQDLASGASMAAYLYRCGMCHLHRVLNVLISFGR